MAGGQFQCPQCLRDKSTGFYDNAYEKKKNFGFYRRQKNIELEKQSLFTAKNVCLDKCSLL